MLLMDFSANDFSIVILCGDSIDGNRYYYVNASLVTYYIHTAWCDNSPSLVELKFSTPHSMIYSIIIVVTTNKDKLVSWLSSPDSD